jgi:hypothetical protein
VGSPLDLSSPDPAYDQRKIASFHRREAHYFRLQAQELSERVLVYESLFGPDSEWVKGARLLARFYEESAEEQERLASSHLGLADHKRSGPRAKPLSP